MQALWSGGDLGSDTAFDVINAGTGATTTVGDTAQAAHGTRSLYTVTTGTSATAYGAWNTAHGTVTDGWYRGYGRLGSLPGVERTVARWLSTTTQRARLVWTSGQKLVIRDSANNVVFTSTTSINASTWVRWEAAITFGTSSPAALRIYTTIDAGKSSFTEELTATGVNFGGTANEVRFGVGAGASNAVDLWLDDVGASDVTWLGPAQETITITGIAVPLTLGGPAQTQAFTVTPTGIAVPAALGSLVLADGSMATGPNGIAVPLTLGGPAATDGSMAVAPDGVAVPAALGGPAISQALTVAPSGIAAGLTLGAPTLTQTFGITPGGIAIPTAVGDPAATASWSGTVSPTGIAVTITLGSPALAAPGSIIPRPNTGTTVRPATGTVTRPYTGIVTRP